MAKRVLLEPAGPYDLELVLRAMASFSAAAENDPALYRAAVRVEGRPCLMEVRQASRRPPRLEATFRPAPPARQAQEAAEWIMHTDLDLRPFYRLVREHPLLGPLTRVLRGLVALRTPSLFVMAVTAITEQQISLVAAYRIRHRMVERFGDQVDGTCAFPSEQALARASIEDLKACGLSTRKAEYIIGLARRLDEGSLNLEEMKAMSDEDARNFCMAIRGLGPWAADYMLIRGLGRPDVVPADDLGLQKLIGFYLGDGARMTTKQVRAAMAPFVPYRGVAAFYMMVAYRLHQFRAHSPKGSGTFGEFSG